MELFMSIAVAVLFLAMGCLAGIFFGRAGNGVDIADQVSADLAHASDGAREAKIETRRQWPK